MRKNRNAVAKQSYIQGNTGESFRNNSNRVVSLTKHLEPSQVLGFYTSQLLFPQLYCQVTGKSHRKVLYTVNKIKLKSRRFR